MHNINHTGKIDKAEFYKGTLQYKPLEKEVTITLDQHRQSFIDCIEAAISDQDVDLARSLLIECEVYGERLIAKLLTLGEITRYYCIISDMRNNYL